MGKEAREKLFLVLAVGLFIRLLIAPYFSLGAHNRFDEGVRWIFVYGFNPLFWLANWGVSNYFFSSTTYIPYLILNYFGFGRVAGQEFLPEFLQKMPQIAGDVLVFYSLCSIARLVSNDPKKSVYVGAAYFLNPYVIRQSSIGTSFFSFMFGFVLLSILNLHRRKIARSAIYLSVAIAFHHIVILLVPIFVIYVLKSQSLTARVHHRISLVFRGLRYRVSFSFRSTPHPRFSVSLLGSLTALYIPFLFVFVSLYLISHSAFWQLVMSYSGVLDPTVLVPLSWFEGCLLNFTGILATLGLWQSLSAFFSLSVFLVAYVVVIAALFKYGKPSAHLLNRCIIVVNTLFLLFLPLFQYPHLLFIFPFLLLEAMVFSGLPRYYSHLLWVSNFALSTIITGEFFNYLHFTFPIQAWSWPLREGYGVTLLPLSISAVHALFLVLTIIFCVAPVLGKFRLRYENIPLSRENIFFTLFFLAYCLFEISRLSYGYGDIVISSIVAGLFILVAGWWGWNKMSAMRRCEQIFSTPMSKAIAYIYLASLTAISISLVTLRLEVPTFLLMQILFLGALWRINRRYAAYLNVQRLSMIFTIIYVFFLLLNTRNIFLGLATLPLLASWIYLQFTVEREFRNEKEKLEGN